MQQVNKDTLRTNLLILSAHRDQSLLYKEQPHPVEIPAAQYTMYLELQCTGGRPGCINRYKIPPNSLIPYQRTVYIALLIAQPHNVHGEAGGVLEQNFGRPSREKLK